MFDPSFYPGQRVKCVAGHVGNDSKLTTGKVYTVKECGPGKYDYRRNEYVYLHEIGDGEWGWMPSRFEPLTVYVSGPMTGYDDYNFPAFNEAAEMLKAEGYEVVNPAAKGIVSDWDWADYLRCDLSEIVDKCNAFYTLPGWQESKGAALEVRVMQALGFEWLNPDDYDDEQGGRGAIQGPGARESAEAGVLPREPSEVDDRRGELEEGDPSGSTSPETHAGVRDTPGSVRSDATCSGWDVCGVSPPGGGCAAEESSSRPRSCMLPGNEELREVHPGPSVLSMQFGRGSDGGRREAPDGNGYISVSANGGEKQVKAEAYNLIPWDAMDAVARVYGFGASKYADHNWRKGYDWSLSIASAFRHMGAYAMGEDYDPESGELHPAHAVFHMLALLAWHGDERFAQFDNRYKVRADTTIENG